MEYTVNDIIRVLEEYAPPELAEEWDNVGLIIGDREQKVDRVLICLDVTPEIIDEAAKKQCHMIISHHPYIFRGLKAIDMSYGKNRGIGKIIKNNISIYSAHTNLDYAEYGVDFYLNRIAENIFQKDISLSEYAGRVKNALNADSVRLMYSNSPDETIPCRSGVFTACGAFDGNIKAMADKNVKVLVTGEIKYNDALELMENGISVIEAGHYQTEIIIIPELKKYLEKELVGIDFYLTTNKLKVSII